MSNYFTAIILHACKQMQHVRSYSAILHLLKGKKSIQTQQDAKLFKLDSIYGIYKHLSKNAFKTELRAIRKEGWIDFGIEDKNRIQITTEGEKWLEANNQFLILHHFHGMDYAGFDDKFYLRLLLVIQTLTNGSKGHMNFIPITDDHAVMNWVRTFYNQYKGKELPILHQIYKELLDTMSIFPDDQCAMFTDKLTGYKHYGLSTAQLARKYRLASHDVLLLISSMLHKMISDIFFKADDFLILSIILGEENADQRGRLSQTALQTYSLYEKGISVEEIATKRMLKMNTIYDHLVEITLCDPAFSIEPFVSKDLQQFIEKIIKNSRTYKLSTIKGLAGENISYFQIRLVLCRNVNT